MTCGTSPGWTHWDGCPCHEAAWAARLAAAEAARERAEKERDEARDCGNSTTEDACGECRACWLITKASLCGRVAAAESALASEREAHEKTKREREAAESRAERLREALREIVSEGQHGEYCHYRNEMLTMGGKTECLSDCPIYVARAALAGPRDAKAAAPEGEPCP